MVYKDLSQLFLSRIPTVSYFIFLESGMRKNSDAPGIKIKLTKDTGPHSGGGGPLMVKQAENEMPRPKIKTTINPPAITMNLKILTSILLLAVSSEGFSVGVGNTGGFGASSIIGSFAA